MTGTLPEILVVVEEEVRTVVIAHMVAGKETAAVRAGAQAGAGQAEVINGQDQGGITLMVIRRRLGMINAGVRERLS